MKSREQARSYKGDEESRASSPLHTPSSSYEFLRSAT